jgi:hypothetical protein
VIINVTGGPDLSLVEVSDASTIVQEAADEDANIIFGAVVDPTLTGKVKVSVIATGFGPPASMRSMVTVAQTPVDMTQYAGHARPRQEPEPPLSVAVSRMTIGRRPHLELPVVPGGTDGLAEAVAPDAAEADSGTPYDVPAFLRRQEG